MTHQDHGKASVEDEPYLLTTQEVAKLLQIRPKTLYQHVARGDYEGACKKQGKHLVFHRQRLLKLVDHSFEKKAKRK